MKKQDNYEILNSFINVIIKDVIKKYFIRLKEKRKKPPKLIENYLDTAIFLVQKYKKINIGEIKDSIYIIDKEKQAKFNKLFNKNKDYQELCQELSFAFILILDKELQKTALELLFENCFEIKLLIDEEIITQQQIDINSIIKNSNSEKITQLHHINSN